MPEDYFEDASGGEAEGGASRYPETHIVRRSHGRPGSGENPGGDRESYEGVGFAGMAADVATLPRLVDPSPAQEADADARHVRGRADSEPGPPTLYCPSCNFKATLFPSCRIWCRRCKTFSELRGGGSGLTVAAVMGVALLLAFVLFYVQGTFDHLLYDIGLQWETCGLRHGQVLCGEELSVGTDAISGSIRDGVKSWSW